MKQQILRSTILLVASFVALRPLQWQTFTTPSFDSIPWCMKCMVGEPRH